LLVDTKVRRPIVKLFVHFIHYPSHSITKAYFIDIYQQNKRIQKLQTSRQIVYVKIFQQLRITDFFGGKNNFKYQSVRIIDGKETAIFFLADNTCKRKELLYLCTLSGSFHSRV
jgi:hypothetical protein